MKRIRINYRKLFLVLILFMYFYDIALKNIPVIFSSRKISLLLMFIYILKYRKRKFIEFLIKYKLLFLIPLSTLLLIIFLIINSVIRYGNILVEYNQIVSNAYYIIFFSISLFFIITIFEDSYEFAEITILTHIVQATFVLVCLINSDIRIFIASILRQLGNLPLDTNLRIIGFSNTGGASVSLLLFTGLISAGYLLIHESSTKIYITYLYILFASFFVAKTGFYLGFVLLLIIIIYQVIKNIMPIKKLIIGFCITSFILIMLMCLLYLINSDDFIKMSQLTLTLLKNGINEASLQNLLNMEIPIRGIDLLFGTAKTRGVIENGVILSHDSGYVRSIFSMGIIGTMFFYGVHIYVFLQYYLLDKYNNFSFYLFICFILIMVVEYKEPFFFKSYLQIVPFSLLLLQQRKESVKCE